MASNTTLVKGAILRSFVLDDSPEGIDDSDDVIEFNSAAEAFYFDNVRGGQSVGDKLFEGFGRNDSLLAKAQIFDGNNDGFIVLGDNARLDVERSNGKNAGTAQFNLIDETGDSIYAVRSLGQKAVGDKAVDKSWVYADASTLVNLINAFNDGADGLLGEANGSQVNVIEGTVGDDALMGTAGVDYFLYDTALGLNLGRDTITGFGVGDRIVTTSAVWNQNSDGQITYGANGILDLPGATGGASSDPASNPGGQVVFGSAANPDPSSLSILGTETIDGTTYYFYGFPTL